MIVTISSLMHLNLHTLANSAPLSLNSTNPKRIFYTFS